MTTTSAVGAQCAWAVLQDGHRLSAAGIVTGLVDHEYSRATTYPPLARDVAVFASGQNTAHTVGRGGSPRVPPLASTFRWARRPWMTSALLPAAPPDLRRLLRSASRTSLGSGALLTVLLLARTSSVVWFTVAVVVGAATVALQVLTGGGPRLGHVPRHGGPEVSRSCQALEREWRERVHEHRTGPVARTRRVEVTITGGTA